MLDRVLAVLSFVCLVVFVGVLIAFIGEVDLTIVAVVVLIMAAFDFYLMLRPQPKSEESPTGQDGSR